MSDTPVKFIRPYDGELIAKLVSVGGTGTPDADGYPCTDANGLQGIIVPEALEGEFYLFAEDENEEVAFAGLVNMADDEEVHWAADPSGGVAISEIRSDVKKSRQFITNKRTRETIGVRQVRYTVKEDDGTTDSFQIDYDPVSGNINPIDE